MYTVLNVIGPKAREMLAELTDVSLKVADFPHMTGKVFYISDNVSLIKLMLYFITAAGALFWGRKVS